MKKIHKKILTAFLPIPLLFAITLCCCQGSHELEKSEHLGHQHGSEGTHECTCPKHLSFLFAQSANIVFDSTVSQMLVKNFMTNLRFDDIISLAALSNHSQDPPLQGHLDQASIPIYLKVSNLRI